MKTTNNICHGSLFMLALSSPSLLVGQVATAAANQVFAAKYIVKTNLVGLALYSINLNFEMKTGLKTSTGLLGGYKIPSTYTLKGIGTLNGEQMTYTGEITPKGAFLNPYFRFYTKEAMTGFYVEAFLRYYDYNYLVPYDYDKEGRLIRANVDGTAHGFGGGISIGGQFSLAQHLFMDIYGGFGVGRGDIHLQTSDPNLDADDYANIKHNIEKNRDSFDPHIFLLGKTITSLTAGADANSAWADITNQLFSILRGGISIGYAF